MDIVEALLIGGPFDDEAEITAALIRGEISLNGMDLTINRVVEFGDWIRVRRVPDDAVIQVRREWVDE